jgi:ABC-type maltose transport system permease subunit
LARAVLAEVFFAHSLRASLVSSFATCLLEILTCSFAAYLKFSLARSRYPPAFLLLSTEVLSSGFAL